MHVLLCASRAHSSSNGRADSSSDSSAHSSSDGPDDSSVDSSTHSNRDGRADLLQQEVSGKRQQFSAEPFVAQQIELTADQVPRMHRDH